MYAVKSDIDSNGNILGIAFAESDWQQETQSSTYFNDECSGYHRTDNAESTNTLNGDGTITSDWSEAWSETWDPQGGSGSGSGSSSGSSSSGSYSGSETTEDPVDNSFAENRQTEPAPVTGFGLMLNAASILEWLGRPGADAVRAAGTNPDTPEDTEEPIHEGGPLEGGGRWEYWQSGTYWWYGEFDESENLVYEATGDMANKTVTQIIYEAQQEVATAEETTENGTGIAEDATEKAEGGSFSAVASPIWNLGKLFFLMQIMQIRKSFLTDDNLFEQMDKELSPIQDGWVSDETILFAKENQLLWKVFAESPNAAQTVKRLETLRQQGWTIVVQDQVPGGGKSYIDAETKTIYIAKQQDNWFFSNEKFSLREQADEMEEVINSVYTDSGEPEAIHRTLTPGFRDHRLGGSVNNAAGKYIATFNTFVEETTKELVIQGATAIAGGFIFSSLDEVADVGEAATKAIRHRSARKALLNDFLDGAADFTSAARRAGGTVLDQNQLRKLEKFFSKRNVKLVTGEEADALLDQLKISRNLNFDPAGVFVPSKIDGEAFLILRSGGTRREMLHEIGHFIHWKRVGPEAYRNLTPQERADYVFNLLRSKSSRWLKEFTQDDRDAEFLRWLYPD